MGEKVLMLDLLLIRHAESLANAELVDRGNLRDTEDSALSPKGEKQAAALGAYLADKGIAAVYSSGLLRAAQTAAAVASGQESKEMFILTDACEIGISPQYGGMTAGEIAQHCPGAGVSPAPGYEQGKLVIGDETPGENEQRYFDRAGKVINYLRERHKSGEKVALVSHAGFLTYIIFYLLGFGGAQPNEDFRLGNTGITRILFYEPGTNQYGDTIFDCVNDRKHIEENYLDIV